MVKALSSIFDFLQKILPLFNTFKADLFFKQRLPTHPQEAEFFNNIYLTPRKYLESFRSLRSERFDIVAGIRDNVPGDFS
jgi:hypothetical protein